MIGKNAARLAKEQYSDRRRCHRYTDGIGNRLMRKENLSIESCYY